MLQLKQGKKAQRAASLTAAQSNRLYKRAERPHPRIHDPGTTMADTLRRLSNAETCRLLQDKLEDWYKDYHVSDLPSITGTLRAGHAGDMLGPEDMLGPGDMLGPEDSF